MVNFMRMGRKGKKKGSKTRNDDKGHNKGGQSKDVRKKLRKEQNWKAGKDDPIRKAVEAGTHYLFVTRPRQIPCSGLKSHSSYF